MLLELCGQRNMAVNVLGTISGVSPSTVYSMLNKKSQNPRVVSIKNLCDRLDIFIKELWIRRNGFFA